MKMNRRQAKKKVKKKHNMARWVKGNAEPKQVDACMNALYPVYEAIAMAMVEYLTKMETSND